jgi:superfamily II DNA or RNA helicase
MATGTGKTIVAADITKSAAGKKKRVLFLAHTNELIEQAGVKISRYADIEYATEKAELTAHETKCYLVVASVQSLSNPKRLARFSKDFFDLIITDEVHRGASDSYVRIYDYFKKAKLLGLTATPFRSDDRSLGDVYDKVSFDYGLEQAIDEGYLVPIRSETIPLKIDISGVGQSGGDFKKSDLGDAIAVVFDAVAKELVDRASDRKICIFLPVITASKKFVDVLNAHGFNAKHVDGKSKDRKELLEWFEGVGPGGVICCSSLLTEGWDCPSVDCVVDLTPTRSTLRYIQKIGRGTRLSPETGKVDLYVPDFLWHCSTHNLCHPACLVAETEEVAEKMVQIQEKGGVKDLQLLEEEAHKELVSEREDALAQALKSFTGASNKKFDPVLQSVSLVDDSLVGWRAETKGEAKPATAEQIAYLERNNFDASGWQSGYAKRVIDIMKKRSEQGLCTPRQVRCLLKNGFPKAHNFTKEKAGLEMDKLGKKWDRIGKYKKRRK